MDVRKKIKGVVSRHPLVLFMKGTPQYPMCADSARVVEALQQVDAKFHAVDVQQQPQIRAALPRYANWPSVPQLFVQGELVGGCEIVIDLLDSGELKRLADDLKPVGA